MTIEYPYTLAQLARILSALENERRNPNTKRNAIKSIERAAAQLDLTADDVFDAADGLLSGRQSAAEFRAALRDEPSVEPAAESAEDETTQGEENDEPEKSDIEPDAERLALKQEQVIAMLRQPEGVEDESVGQPATEPPAASKQPRANSKQALLIAMLRRPEGATIAQIMHETGWLAHTCRGAIAGTLKKKLGLYVTSGKIEGRGRVYKIDY